MADKTYLVAFAGAAVEDDFYGDVASLTVEESTSAASTLALRLNTRRRDDGSWSYMDDGRLAPFMRVSVSVGFTGGAGLAGVLGGVAGVGGDDGVQPIFDGYVTDVNIRLGSQPGDAHVEVTAMDACVLMSLEEKVVRWPNLADSDIVQQIVGSYGLQVRAEPTSIVHQERDTTILQRGTDIRFVRGLARRNGFEFYLETDKTSGTVVAHFRPPDLQSSPQADLAIQFGAESNLRSCSLRQSGLRPLNVVVEQLDVKTNTVNSGQAGAASLQRLGAQDPGAVLSSPLGALVTPRRALGQMFVLAPPTSDATELQTLAQVVRDEAEWWVSASGEVNTDAYQSVLRPRRLVLIKGIGSPYSGKYYVTSVTHQLRADGSYTQTFEARRNARDLDGGEQFGSSRLGLAIAGV